MKVHVSATKREVAKRLGDAYFEFLLACGDLGGREPDPGFREEFEDQLNSKYYKYRDKTSQDTYIAGWHPEDVVAVREWYFGLGDADRNRILRGVLWTLNDCGGAISGWVTPKRPEDFVSYILRARRKYRRMGETTEDLTFIVSAFADAYGLRPIKAEKEKR